MASNGNKKHGRNKKRHLSSMRYTETKRWDTNKNRRIAKEKRRQSACKAVRSLAGTVFVRDVSRRVRKAARA